MKKNHNRNKKSSYPKKPSINVETQSPLPTANADEYEAQGFIPMSESEIDNIAQNITAALEKAIHENPDSKLNLAVNSKPTLMSKIQPELGAELSDEDKKKNYLFLSAISIAVCFTLWVGFMTVSSLFPSDTPSAPIVSTTPEVSPQASPDIESESKPSTDNLVPPEEIVEPTPTATPQRPMATKTEVYKMLTDVGVGSKYATLYAPKSNIDAPIYFGDSEDILMQPAIAQSAQTYQIGYASSHLMCSYEPSIATGIKSMKIGERFSVETSYGVYVYSVSSATIGTMNAETGYIVDTSGNNLFSLDDTTDTIYLYTDYSATQQYVVRATLCA